MTTAQIDRVDDVNGWPLTVVRGEAQPFVAHREVARRLGYERHDMILDLAVRVLGAEWKLSAPYREFRDGLRGPKSRDYLLTRREVIRLSMRSDAPNADSIQEEIATVYEAWLDGRQAKAPDVAAIVAMATRSAIEAVMPMFDRMLAAEREAREETKMVIGPRRARALLDRIGTIAMLHAQRGSKAWRKTHRRVSNDVRDRLKLGVSGAWAALPDRYLAEVDAALDRIEKAERERTSDQQDLAVVLDLHPKRGA